MIKVAQIEDIDKILDRAPAISPKSFDLVTKIDDFSTPRSEISKLVSMDTVLVAKLFRFANSAVFGCSTELHNIDDAIDLVGLDRLKALVFVTAAKSCFPDPELWHRSVFYAVASQEFARKLGMTALVCDAIYLAALLKVLGLSLLKRNYPEAYCEVETERDLTKRLEMEEQRFSINYIDLSLKVLEKSSLPKLTLEILEAQKYVANHDKFRRENAVIELVKFIYELDFNSDEGVMKFIESRYIQSLINDYDLNALRVCPKRVKELQDLVDAYIA